MVAFPHSASFQAARRIAQTLANNGFVAYLAGGCVRDLLLGHAPKDFDVATSAHPDQVVALFPNTVAVGAHFGVILVVDHVDGERRATEVATFRHDGAYLDGRRPEVVRFSDDPREDVLRRDFTINGMLLDLDSGEVLDFVGGQDDLRAGLVRAIGDPNLRFEEDKLRMLRGVRFAARLGFPLDPHTLAAIERHAPEIGQVSNERVRDEVTRMLTEGAPRKAFELLSTSGLLREVLPEIERLKGVEQPPEFHPEGDVWIHTMMLLDHLPAGASPTLAWGMLLHDVGKPATFQAPTKAGDRIRFNGHVEVGVRIAEEILRRLRFSKEEEQQIVSLVKHHMQFGDVKHMKQSTLKRFIRMPLFEEHLALHRADCMSAHGDLRLYDYAKISFDTMEEDEVRPKLLVTGRELIDAGYKPGTAFKVMLLAAEDAQLEGRITTTDEGMELVRREFGVPPPPCFDAKSSND